MEYYVLCSVWERKETDRRCNLLPKLSWVEIVFCCHHHNQHQSKAHHLNEVAYMTLGWEHARLALCFPSHFVTQEHSAEKRQKAETTNLNTLACIHLPRWPVLNRQLASKLAFSSL